MLRKGYSSAKSFNMQSLAGALPSSQFKLRDYQVSAIDCVLQALSSGVMRPAVVLATGGGKTVVMAHLIPKIKGTADRRKTLVLAHKEELIHQAAKTLRQVNTNLKVDIDMSKSKPSDGADVIVGSVPTLVRLTRLHQYKPEEFKAIIIDECHHATAGSWTKILNHFSALEGEIPVIGFTATFERADGIALGKVFEKVVYERNLFDMIQKGELCDAKFLTMKLDLDLDNVKITSGDFRASELAEVMNKENINVQVTMAYLELRKQYNLRATLVFCVDVEHCRALCGVLQANGVNAQYVTGNTVKHERKAILDDFRAGKIQVLCNVLVFTEGTDIPNIDSLVLARPTKSRPLLTQMIGRGLRLHQGKDVCHIVDLAGTIKVGVSSVPHLFGLPEDHKFERKSFRDLQDEKTKLSDAEMQTEANKRATAVNRMLELHNEVKNLEVQFDTVDGFANMFTKSGIVDNDTDDTLQTFRNDRFFWVRLEYNLWGLQVADVQSYLTIGRNQDKTFTLTQVRLSPFIPKIYNRRKIETKISTGSLISVLSSAGNIAGAATFKLARELKDKPATASQTYFLSSSLYSKVQGLYGYEVHGRFTEQLKSLSRFRAFNLIFATKYSVNCLWVQWELRKMLGPTMKEQRKMELLQNKINSLGLRSPIPDS